MEPVPIEAAEEPLGAAEGPQAEGDPAACALGPCLPVEMVAAQNSQARSTRAAPCSARIAVVLLGLERFLAREDQPIRADRHAKLDARTGQTEQSVQGRVVPCLLYTSDAADDL